MNQRRRLDKVQQTLQPPRRMLEIPLYACTVDGEPMELELLDAWFRKDCNGQEVTIGGQCGVRYEPEATQEEFERNMAEVRAWFAADEAEYNRDPEAYNLRMVEEREEIRRLAPLRHEDILAGRDPDKCHPIPWRHNQFTKTKGE